MCLSGELRYLKYTIIHYDDITMLGPPNPI